MLFSLRPFFFTGALIAWLVSSAQAQQFEPTLLPERSVRYQTTSGLFGDDFDAFYAPRSLTRWDGTRLATQLTNLSPVGLVSLGYGQGTTDGLSWSVFAAGAYRSMQTNGSRQSLQTFESEAGLLQTDRLSPVFEPPAERKGNAHGAMGMAWAAGAGWMSVGLQARWRSDARETLALPPLFTFSTQEEALPSFQSERTVDIETGRTLVSRSVSSQREFVATHLDAALVGGYSRPAAERGWGWGLDLIGGMHRTSERPRLSFDDTSRTPQGLSQVQLAFDGNIVGTSPYAGAAFVLERWGKGRLWFDLGGDWTGGARVDGSLTHAEATHTVNLFAGGLDRRYRLAETRIDNYTGVLDRAWQAVAGFRYAIPVDPLLVVGWGLHGRWYQAEDEVRSSSLFRIHETFDADGDDSLGGASDVNATSTGQLDARQRRSVRVWQFQFPIALTMRSAADPAVEWRLGSEIRYTQTHQETSSFLENAVLPSGRRFVGDASVPVRFGNMVLPSGKTQRSRRSELDGAIRAGLGYWFTATAKVDVIVVAESAGGGLLNLSARSAGISALLAF